MLNGHEPITLNQFNGIWQRGDPDEVPQDHFTDAINLRHVATGNIRTRDGVGISQEVAVPLENVKRVYNYPTQTANTQIVLVINGNDGEIYHVVDSTTVYGPILTITGMTDFAFVPYAGRGYISPIAEYTLGELTINKGMNGEFLYVYAGDGTAARKAAGAGMSGSLTIANGAAASMDAGFHLFAFVSETASGYLCPPSAITGFTVDANFSVSFTTVPTSADPNVTKRYLVATKAISNYNGNTEGYQFFFVPGATINNNTDTFLSNVQFFDADLLEDASHLLENYTEIPAGVNLCMYHDRLCLLCTYDDISIILVSAPGEPEAINQITGLLIFPLDGNPLTNARELRDVLYAFKRNRTGAWVDNGDDPSSWPFTMVDSALGASIHGIANVLDSGGNSVDFLIIGNYKGINLFNGTFQDPELSWKIRALWEAMDKNEYGAIQIVNDPSEQMLYCVLVDGRLLTGNYANGLAAKTIRWEPWGFLRNVNTVALVNNGELILGMDYL